MSFWYNNKILGMLGVTIKSLDTFYNITHVDVEFLASKGGFTFGKCWPFRWKLSVDDFVQFGAIFER
jgi:hypothetical protein